MKYPKPLKKGSKIAITAFSSGVAASCHQRLDIVLTHLKALGFEVIEGQCLREDVKHVSANKNQRAAELMTFLCDDSIDAILPPWGGEFAMEILPLLNYERLKTVKPKWLMGFSDVSTILTTLTTKLNWSTMHATNLMQLHPLETDKLTATTLSYLKREQGEIIEQNASEFYQIDNKSFAQDPNVLLNLTEQTRWKSLNQQTQLNFSGRLIGGCFDTILHIIGTEYFDFDAFHLNYIDDGIILYLENAEMSPTVLMRALLSLKYKGVFNKLNGLLLGRNAVITNNGKEISSFEALINALDDLDIPVIYDVDIGHLPPNLTLFNGAFADVSVSNDVGKIKQTLM